MTADTPVMVTKAEATSFLETDEGNFIFVEPNLLHGAKLIATSLRLDNYLAALGVLKGTHVAKTYESTIGNICGEHYVRC
jgi:hypothetical protein